MDKDHIYKLITEAKKAIQPKHADPEIQKQIATVKTLVTDDAQSQYIKYASLLFCHQEIEVENNQYAMPKKKVRHEIDFSISPDVVIRNVQSAGTKATLRKYARSIRHVAIQKLYQLIKEADSAQRNGDWQKVIEIVAKPEFKALTELSRLLPADYANGWKPADKYFKKDKDGNIKTNGNEVEVKPPSRPNSKKTSLSRLPNNWREMMAEKSVGRYRIPMLVAMITGCRPAELENGVLLEKANGGLYVKVFGVKVKQNAGQEFRIFKLANHPLTTELMMLMTSINESNVKVQVENGNSVTTHMRSLAKKIWPKRTKSVTVYTARHAMAADCKAAIEAGADPDMVSQVLGHVVDKTASYYGNRFQSGGISTAPSDINVPKPIKQKSSVRNRNRLEKGKVPGHPAIRIDKPRV